MAPITHVYVGRAMHALAIDRVVAHECLTIGVSAEGKIECVEEGSIAVAVLRESHAVAEDVAVRTLTGRQFLMPGFVDTHIHAPQIENMGKGYDLPLLDWLQKYTFPAEEKYADEAYAREMYSRVVDRLLKCGTTTASYFASLHASGSRILAAIVAERGQRAYVGKVSMDQLAPDSYLEETAQGLADAEAFVKETLEQYGDLVQPVVTPRFVPSCSVAMLKGLGALAKKYDVPIQSHLDESKNEIKMVLEQHPDCASYAGVYDSFGLLNSKTIMAHSVWTTDEELDLLQQRGVGIAHCASSNFSIFSGVFNVRKHLRKGIKVGLGTDVSGGYEASIMGAMRQSITASAIHYIQDPETKPLSFKEALFLATLGGAQVMALDDRVGNFVVGKDFDALVVDVDAEGSQVAKPGPGQAEPFDDILSKFVFSGDDRNIAEVFVRGRSVSSR